MKLGSRDLFPELEPRVYANHAAISPMSTLVRDALVEVWEDYAAKGVHAYLGWLEQRLRLKEEVLLGLLGVSGSAKDIAFSASTTRALSDAALCLDWQQGDRVLLFSGEFPANVTPWVQAAAAFGASVDVLPQSLSAAEEALKRGGVRVLAVSAVQFQTGRRMPVRELIELAHRYGALIAVDAIQALGVVPLDLEGADLVAGGSHKWAMGIEGLGYLYVRPGTPLVPRVAGWWSHEDPVDFLFAGAGKLEKRGKIREQGDFLEMGSVSAVGAAALWAGLVPMRRIGIERVYEHVQAWHDRVEPVFVSRGFESLRGESGSLCFSHARAVEVSEALCEAGISVSAPDGVLRLSPHWCNDLDEHALIAEELDRCL